jgi:hypothetical protein
VSTRDAAKTIVFPSPIRVPWVDVMVVVGIVDLAHDVVEPLLSNVPKEWAFVDRILVYPTRYTKTSIVASSIRHPVPDIMSLLRRVVIGNWVLVFVVRFDCCNNL